MNSPSSKTIPPKDQAPPAPRPENGIQSKASAPAPQAPAAKRPFWPVPVTGLLFAAWLGYLIYLVANLPGPPPTWVLSRPQFLVSDLDVIAQVDSVGGPVIIKEVVYPKSQRNSLVGQAIVVTNLDRCQPLLSGEDGKVRKDFSKPGLYILALRPTRLALTAQVLGLLASPDEVGPFLVSMLPPPESATALSYEVVPTPPSPGYPPVPFRDQRTGPPRIYRANEVTRAELKQINKPE